MSNENVPQNAPTGGGPLTPEQARDEFQRVMSDPSHPHHEGYKKGWTTANNYVEGIYKRIPGGDTLIDVDVIGGADAKARPDATGVGVKVGGGVAAGADTDAEDSAFRENVARALAESGVSMDDTAREAARLFAGKDGAAVENLLDTRALDSLSPRASIDAHVQLSAYFADLHKLRSTPSGGDATPVAPEAFQASLDAALAERGINRQTIVEMENHIFAGAPGALAHFRKYLDSMPPGARVQAYVRSAEALMTLSRLYQSRS